jgi:D-galactose 1-dehydrogenase
MEKPPCASLAQLGHLQQLASAARCTLYQTWHSQHAAGIASAARLLQFRRLQRVRVAWQEDVLKWHPGQKWIWQAGGFGVLDPGINALSILTRLIAEPIFPRSALLLVPANLEAPIAAELELLTAGGVEIGVSLDFRHTGPQTWDIDFETDQGPFKLSAGGATLTIAGEPAAGEAGELHGEYTSIYRAYAELIAAGRSEVDARPLELVADIFLNGKQVAVAPFREPYS